MRNIVLSCQKQILTEKALICETFLERGRGLLFRPALSVTSGDALLIPKCNSIHTFWMQYTIDVIFLDIHQCVLSIHVYVPRRRVVSAGKAQFALEVAAGNLWAGQLRIGDPLKW